MGEVGYFVVMAEGWLKVEGNPARRLMYVRKNNVVPSSLGMPVG